MTHLCMGQSKGHGGKGGALMAASLGVRWTLAAGLQLLLWSSVLLCATSLPALCLPSAITFLAGCVGRSTLWAPTTAGHACAQAWPQAANQRGHLR